MTYGFETLAIHAGQDPDPRTGAVVPPIYQTSTYAQDAVGAPRLGYEYSRTANPTRDALQECLAALEHGRYAIAFASGLAAEDTLLRALCQPGDHVVVPDDAYGGTFRLFAKVAQRWGLRFSIAHMSNVDDVRANMTGDTRIVWVETPTNPLLGIADIAALAQLAHDRGALLVVDNTFASPYLQQPLLSGADVVVHSTTKYLGGHSDVIGGALVVNDESLAEPLRYHQNAMGAVGGPFDAWLTLRGGFRTGDPGLAIEVCNRARLFVLGESLGGVESLIEHPGRMTHASVTGSPLEVPADLVRLSVGIETVEDLLADLEHALG